jgi:hypothetical protein
VPGYSLLTVTIPNALAFVELHSITADSRLSCKSKSRYNRRSVGQSVLLSDSFWGPRPEFCYCQTGSLSVGRSNSCWSSPAQSVLASVSSRSMTQDFCTLPDMYVFRSGAFSLTRKRPIFLCRRYFCCTVVYIRAVTSPRSLWTLCTLCQCKLMQQVMP